MLRKVRGDYGISDFGIGECQFELGSY